MAYPTICDECLAGDHKHCSESKLIPDAEQLRKLNDEHPEDVIVGGGFCVCRHGAPEGAWAQSVRDALQVAKPR